EDAGRSPEIGVIVLTGAGDRAFCVGGDATEVSERAGYSEGMLPAAARLHELIRSAPQPVIAAVNGYAIGGGHVFHLICDLTIASENARFGQVGPRVGSFDAAFGSLYLACVVGEKKAREVWYLCRQYTAREALEMGLVNTVVPHDKLEEEVDRWCQEILEKSPTAIRYMKASFNVATDFIISLQKMAYGAAWMYYQTPEAGEGKAAFKDKRKPDFWRHVGKEGFGW
ncbi:MAG: enoyl-CoA hydratase-related protein, partial [Firmicutes bacterium]|nr:enoyl-CoA hydratase-related protein [Bacillota bacterium]